MSKNNISGKTLFEENLERIMQQAKNDPKWIYQPSFRVGLTIEEENRLKQYSGLLPISTAQPIANESSDAQVSTTKAESEKKRPDVIDNSNLNEDIKRWLELSRQIAAPSTAPESTRTQEKSMIDPRYAPSSIKKVDEIKREQNKRNMEQMSEDLQGLSKDHRVLGTAMNLGLSATTPSAAVETVNQFFKSLSDKDYKPDPYAQGMMPIIAQRATEEGVLDGLEGTSRLLGSTALSIGQNLIRLPLGQAGLINMAVGAGGQSAQDVMERGGTMNQAVAKGIVSGATEYLTEKIPFDKLNDLIKGGAKTISKNAVIEVLKQAGSEAGEEAIAEIVNTLSDIAIMVEDSEYRQYEKELINSGLSEGEASKKALTEFFVWNTLKSGFGGFVSGGILGAPAAALGSSYTKSLGKSLGQDSVGELIHLGLANDKESESHRMATAAQERLNKGESLSDSDIGSIFIQLSADEEKSKSKTKEKQPETDETVPLELHSMLERMGITTQEFPLGITMTEGKPDVKPVAPEVNTVAETMPPVPQKTVAPKPATQSIVNETSAASGYADEFEEIRQSAGVEFFTPKTAGNAVKTSEQKLIEQGVDDDSRKSIVNTFAEYESKTQDSGIKPVAVFGAIDRLQIAERNSIRKVFGNASEMSGKLYDQTAKLITQADGRVTEDYIKNYADEWAGMLENANGAAYQSIVKDGSVTKKDIAGLLTDYVINGDITDTAVSEQNKAVLIQTANDFKDVLTNSISEAARIHAGVWGKETVLQGQAGKLAAGDWAGVLETETHKAKEVQTQPTADSTAGIDASTPKDDSDVKAPDVSINTSINNEANEADSVVLDQQPLDMNADIQPAAKTPAAVPVKEETDPVQNTPNNLQAEQKTAPEPVAPAVKKLQDADTVNNVLTETDPRVIMDNKDSGAKEVVTNVDKKGDVDHVQGQGVLDGESGRGSIGESEALPEADGKRRTGRDAERGSGLRGTGVQADIRPADGDEHGGSAVRDGKSVAERDINGGMEQRSGSGGVRGAGHAGDGFVITDRDSLDNRKPNFNDNIAAIKLLKQLEAENKQPTPQEKEILAKFKGWGGLKEAFTETSQSSRMLKSILTDSEYKAARSTILNAHYTSTKVIDGMYKALKQLGYKGGNLLEPSMGTGNFFGVIPGDMAKNTQLYGVEIDGITGKIAKMLYPNAKIEISPFQDVTYKDSSFDAAVGNVPFLNVNYPYKGGKYALHDYVIIKSLDKLKDNGIAMFLTSTGTLDKVNPEARKAIADRANLIAAFRLPNNAFKINAGTEVTTDLLILQKKPAGTGSNGIGFQTMGLLDGIPINEYYVNNPDNILGKLVYKKEMYANERTQVEPLPGDFTSRFEKALLSLPKDIMNAEGNPVVDNNASNPDNAANADAMGFRMLNNGKAVFASPDGVKTYEGKQARRIKHYIGIRNAYNSLLNSYTDEGITAKKRQQLREQLNRVYDAFVKDAELQSKFGGNKAKGNWLNSPENSKLLSADDDFWKVAGLELWDKDKDAFVKSDIFSKDTIIYKKPDRADNAADALAISLNDTGKADLQAMEKLTGFTREKLLDDLQGYVIETPDGGIETVSGYLSGNIRKKLAEAEKAAERDPKFKTNAEMLRNVMPREKTPAEIVPQLGASWIKPEYVAGFMKETFGMGWEPTVSYNKLQGAWMVSNTTGNNHLMYQKYGTRRMSAIELTKDALNMVSSTVYDKKDNNSVVNQTETSLARQKQTEIREAFRDWAYKDKGRRDELVKAYNELFNSHRNMDYEELAKYVSFPNISENFKLRDYQRTAVGRIIFGGDTLLAHGVGTGKTAEMISAAMELKRMGITHKNAMVVPKLKISDFRNEILRMYPGAKVLMATEKDFNKENRSKLFARIASNDWDIVIIGHSSFGMIPVSNQTLAQFVEKEKNDVENVLNEIREKENRNIDKRFVKQLENSRANLDAKLGELLTMKKDDTITFEEMGIDGLFVDEAHNYKNLAFYSKLKVSGIKGGESKRASDMFMKTGYIRGQGGRIVFATATPITNTVSEMYNMTRFVNPGILEDAGIYSFDAWASVFGNIETKIEMSPDGRSFRTKERFAKYVNVPEMISMFRQYADIKKTSDVIKELPVAERIDVVSPSTGVHDSFIDMIMERIKSISSRGQSKGDNMLLVTNDGRAMATDLRLVSRQFKDAAGIDLDPPGSKINMAVGNIVKEYRDSKKVKGTQFVFLDFGKFDNAEGRYAFNLYNDLIQKLVRDGVPQNEIAVIDNYDTAAKKETLFNKVNAGEIRVLIGSTARMGEGMNAQERAVALHHLNAPYRPSDIEQREGRIIRFGNRNKNVRIYKYIQEKSFDSYMWQMLARKAEFINQSMSSGDMLEMEEIDEFVLSAKESMAIATGNPLIMKKVEVDEEVKRLRMLQKSHLSEIYSMQDRLARIPDEISKNEKLKHNVEADIKTVESSPDADEDKFMTVGSKKYSRKDAAAALAEAVNEIKGNDSMERIGQYKGLDLMYVNRASAGGKGTVILQGKSTHMVDLGDSPEGNITRIVNEAVRLPGYSENLAARVERLKQESASISEDINKPFKYQTELEAALKEQADVNAKLNIGDKNDVSGVITEDMNDNFTDEREQVEAAESSEYALSDDGGKKPADLRMKTFADIAGIMSRVSTVKGVELFDDSSDLMATSDKGKGFSEQVDEWLRGEMEPSGKFELGDTPFVLQKLGARNLPLIMTKEVMAKITGEKHSIALDELKNLPASISDPIMVFKSSTHPDAFVVLTGLDDKEDKKVIAAVHFNKMHQHHTVNIIASVYGKDNILNFISKETAKGNLRYINKNKSRQWFQSARLQLPLLETATSTSNNNILTERDIVNDSVLQKPNKNTKYSMAKPKINAYFDKATRKIYLNRNADKPHMLLLGHELFHSLNEPDQNKIIALLLEGVDIKSEKFKKFKAEKTALYAEKYRESGKEFTDKDFYHEFAAENMETLFTNKSFVERLTGKYNELARRILEFIRKIWSRIAGKPIYTNSHATDAAEITAETLAKAEKLFAEALGVKSWNMKTDDAIYTATAAERALSDIGFGDEEKLFGSANTAVSSQTNNQPDTWGDTTRHGDVQYALSQSRKDEMNKNFEDDRVTSVPKNKQEKLGTFLLHNVARVFPEISESGEKGTYFAEFRKLMIRWNNLPKLASHQAQMMLDNITKGLTKEEFLTFNKIVVFRDMREEALIQTERGQDVALPRNYTLNDVEGMLDELQKDITPAVEEALKKRRETWNKLKDEYISLNKSIGFDVEERFSRDEYFRHQIIDYMNGAGTGNREVEVRDGRGWLRHREGSELPYNTDYLYVEHSVLMQMQYDVYIADTLNKVKQYDIKSRLEKEALQHNKALLDEMIMKEASEGEPDGKPRMKTVGGRQVPDSALYDKQQFYNSRIMMGFSGLFELGRINALPSFDGTYRHVVNALTNGKMDVADIYKYVGTLAGLTEGDADYNEQAVISARTILKYTAQKKAWLKQTLGRNYQTWESLARANPENKIFQPRKGNYFYKKEVLDEDAFEKAVYGMADSLIKGEGFDMNAETKQLFEQYSHVIRQIGAAYEQWVLPSEIVATMDRIGNPKMLNIAQKVGREITGQWKGWSTMLNPLRTVKFAIRNFFGDLDAVIAGKPQLLKFAPEAVNQIYDAMRYKKYTPEFQEWIERGGYSNMIFAQEMDTEMQDKLFAHLKEKAKKSGKDMLILPFEKIKGGIETAHNFREAILRYSAYLYFKDNLTRNGGVIKDYVASNPAIVKGLHGLEDKAYQLSKDLLGAYDEVSSMGQTLRRYFVPFYSFEETNMKRYFRMFANTLRSDASVPEKIGKFLLKILMTNLVPLMLIAWNKIFMPDAEEKLPPQVRNRPHLTLGEYGDNVYAFTRLGSFSSVLEWAGFDDYQWTKEDITEPANKLYGMVTPFAKLLWEVPLGVNPYPDVTKPRAIRDRAEYVFNSFGVADFYRAFTGKPTQGIGNTIENAFLYKYDYKVSAYNEILDRKREFQKKNDTSVFSFNDKSNALYYMKLAVKYDDKKAALKYLDKYFEAGGTAEGILDSFATMNPMYGFTSKETMKKGTEFVRSLDSNEAEKLRIAQRYYENELALPNHITTSLKRKGITDQQAKNVLKTYIEMSTGK